ncbi:hypothetical protein [Clostridium felsineum]|uniref:hypothetical protein n=1 Tax=Clostridium felsineum TaxID=36839 RepID=UPI00098BE18C|nr:hypothetical protein [Clostridium felsineum]URZ00578.1 hypothetical protein CLAUR_005660 [Clostridium felsineum]
MKAYTPDYDETERIIPNKEITLGEYLKSIENSMKINKYVYLINTKYEINGMANFIFFYRLGRLFYNHSSGDSFEIEDVKMLPIQQINVIKEFNRDGFYFDLDDSDENFINLNYTELEILLSLIEEKDIHIKYERQVLKCIYKRLLKEYNKMENVVKDNKEYVVSKNIRLDMQQYISLYILVNDEVKEYIDKSFKKGSAHKENYTKTLFLILNKIKQAIAIEKLGSYSPLFIRGDYNEEKSIFDI